MGLGFSAQRVAILRSVSYFDIYDYPLTAFEVWRWLYRPDGEPAGLKEIWQELRMAVTEGQLGTQDGFYFLAGRGTTVATRAGRYQDAHRKMRIARRAAGWLYRIGLIEGVAVCNRLGFSNTPAEGDIDFFMIAQRGRIWLSRLLANAAIGGLGIRRHAGKIADRVCLSFYLTNQHYDLSDIVVGKSDPYLQFWLITLAPFYGHEHFTALRERNQDLLRSFPNQRPIQLNRTRRLTVWRWCRSWQRFIRWALGGRLGGVLEVGSRRLQMRDRYLRYVKTIPEPYVVLSDSILKFHERDMRAAFRQRWQNRLARYQLSL